MPFEVVFTSEALEDFAEAEANLWEFSPQAALELERLVKARLLLIATQPNMDAVAVRSGGNELRIFVIKSRTILYLITDSKIVVLRVFGPGRDWQQDI